MLSSEEQQLLTRLRAGDSRATITWYHQYRPRLTKLVLSRVGHPADAEEIVQEIFINCLTNLPQFVGRSSLWTWMVSIAQHEISDYYRKQYAKKVLHLLPLDWLKFVDQIDQQLSRAELKEKVELVWPRIGNYNRELLLAKYLDSQSVAELARARGKTVKAVESELFRARQAFKAAYRQIVAEFS